jgi:hypothetical protein
LPQAGPFHIFHHQAVEVSRLADVEHGHDERVPQLRERARLAEEPLLECVIGVEVGPDDLDGDESVQERLAALVDDPHSGLAQQFHHFQVGEARGQFCGRRWREPCLRKNCRLVVLDLRGIRLRSTHGVESTICSGFSQFATDQLLWMASNNPVVGPFI